MADVPAKLNYNESVRRIPEKVNEILDYLRRTRIQVDSRTMRKNETPAGITLSAQRQTVATPAQRLPADEYTGYFKITDASEGDAFKVKVADGAAGEASTCKVNNIVFSVPAWTSEVITATRLVVLKYTAATKASGEAPAEAAKVELVLLETLPSDDNLNCYYQIGRAIVDQDGSRKIQQDHRAVSANGIAQIYWYNLCDQ